MLPPVEPEASITEVDVSQFLPVVLIFTFPPEFVVPVAFMFPASERVSELIETFPPLSPNTSILPPSPVKAEAILIFPP